jgi:arabinoxylan arabinofuranohydrolase
MLSANTSIVHGGLDSLKISWRTAAWNGPSQALTGLVKGQSYTVRVWVRSQTGTPVAKATIKLTAGATSTYLVLAQAAVNPSGWTLLTGTGIASWIGTLTSARFYVETAAGTDNFTIDDARLYH